MFRYPERFVSVFLIPGVIFACDQLHADVLRRKRTRRMLVPAALCFLIIADAHVFDPFTAPANPYPYSFYRGDRAGTV